MVIGRLKREQCNRTKHDSSFSHWKILIGPSDWEDYSKGKEGCERYRIHNLPKKSGPGLYEIAVSSNGFGLGREIYKFAPDTDRLVVVYLGQADNVRARLQRYGRTGAHLNTSSSDLFQHIFSHGFPILYRWAPMQSKGDALQTEAELLSTFDYAWNTCNNGTRRPDDILQKLNKIATGTRTLSDVTRMLLPFTQKKVGIRIKSSKVPLPDDKSDEADNGIGSYNFLSGVFKFNRSRPRIVQAVTGVIQNQENAKICGVTLRDGSICRRPPVEGRMRCPEHKGMRTNASAAKSVKAPKSESIVERESNEQCQTKDNGYRYKNVSYDIVETPKMVIESPVDESITSTTNICGIILDDGSTCGRQPVKGRMRCPEHKGMRTNASAKSVKAPKPESIMERESNVQCQTKDNGYRYKNVTSSTSICGIILDDGSTCRRQPVKGRKRCQEHKGKRIRAYPLI